IRDSGVGTGAADGTLRADASTSSKLRRILGVLVARAATLPRMATSSPTISRSLHRSPDGSGSTDVSPLTWSRTARSSCVSLKPSQSMLLPPAVASQLRALQQLVQSATPAQ